MKRSRTPDWVWWLALLGGTLVFAVMWVARSVAITDSLRPPVSVNTLDSFALWRGARKTEYFSGSTPQGPIVIAAVREHISETRASGPACYVFDSSLRLTAYSVDIGEDPQFQATYLEYLNEKNRLDTKAISDLLRTNR